MGKLRVLRLFKRKGVTQKIEELNNKIEENFKPTILELITNWFTILGTVVSLVLAFWAIFLTKKYGESQDQINKLTIIAENQRRQTDALFNLLSDLKKQNELTQYQNDELKAQGKQISTQSLNQSQQLLINQKQLKQTLFYEGLKRKENITMLRMTFNELGELTPYQGAAYLKNYSFQLQKESLQKIVDILERGRKNPILIENDTLLKKWNNLYNNIKFHLNQLDVPFENVTHVKMVDGKLVGIHDSLETQKTLIGFWGHLVDKFYDTYFDLLNYVKKLEKDTFN